MPSPTYHGATSGYDTSATTSRSVSLPSGVAAGDLLLLCTVGNAPFSGTAATGFTQIDLHGEFGDESGGTFWTAWKVAAGGETSVTVTTTESTTVSWIAVRLSNATYDTKATLEVALNSAPNAGTPTDPVEANDYLELTIAGWLGFTYVSTWPYGSGVGSNTSSSSPSPAEGVALDRTTIAGGNAPENPPAFALDGSTNWIAAAYTITYVATAITGSSAITEQSDTCTAQGTAGGVVGGSAAITELSDTSAGSGSAYGGNSGSAAITEQSDTATASGSAYAEITGSGASTEATDSSSGIGTVGGAVTGSAAITELTDVSAGSGSASDSITGSADILASADVMYAYGIAERRCAKHMKGCCPECLIGEDDCNRANSTNPGPLWTVIGGEWHIDNNELLGVTDGLIYFNPRPPAPTRFGAGYNYTWLFDIAKTGSVNEWHVICARRSNTDYDWIKITEDGSSGVYYPQFITGGDPGTVILDKTTHPLGQGWTFDETNKLALSMCYAEVEWSITPNAQGENNWHTCDAGGLASLPDVGGVVGFKKGRFDNVIHRTHWQSNPECDGCQCYCDLAEDDYLCLPETLTLTLVPTSGAYNWGSGSCPDPSNRVVTLYQQDPDESGSSPVYGASRKVPIKRTWYSDLLVGDGGSNLVPSKTWFTFVCSLSDGMLLTCQNYPQDHLTSPCCGSGGDAVWVAPDTVVDGNDNAKLPDLTVSTCDPLNLVFRQLQFPRSAMGQCYVYGERYDCYITV